MGRTGLRVAVIIIAVVAAVGYGYFRLQERGKPVVVLGRVVAAKRGDITLKVSETGTLDPVTKVDVKSRVAGRVLHIYVKEGQSVKQGTLIATVDPTEVARQVEGIKAQLSSSRAALLQAEENYNLTRRQSTLSIQRAKASLAEAKARLVQTAAPNRREDILQAEQAVVRAQAQVVDARRNLNRKMSLVARGFLAQSEADTAQTNLALAETDLESAKQRLALQKEGPRFVDIEASRKAVYTAQIQLETEKANSAQTQLRLRDVERARGDVAQIENQLAQQSVSLVETRIVAPITGEVIGKFVSEGELIASATAGFAQGAALVTLADLSRMQVKVNVNEVDLPRVRVGQPVEVRVDGLPGKVFQGKVASIAPSSLTSTSSSVVRFEVKVAVLNPNRSLRPGMTAAVNIITKRQKDAVLLPTEALRGENRVTVVTGTGKSAVKTERVVRVGLKDEAKVEILSGLNAGDRVEVPKIDAKDRRKISFSDDNGSGPSN